MKRSSDSHLSQALVILAAVALASTARAQTATQDVSLSAGWNAVWLEVEPVTAAGLPKPPEEVFNNIAIKVVATPRPRASLAEFFASDPATVTTFNQDEWQQWKQADPPGANNLALIFGNQPYLIQVKSGTPTFSLALTGKARFFRPTWTAGRYNLLGFGLDGAPTFDQFFGPSGAKHPVTRIFTLNPDGSWVRITGGSPMVSDRAYWIFSTGPSTYMGPVAVDFDQATTGRLDFGGPGDAVPTGTGVDLLNLDLEELIFTNLGSSVASPELDLISTDAGGLDLHVIRPASGTVGFVRGNQVDSATGAAVPPATTSALGESVASLRTAALTLGARRRWSTGAPTRTNLYRLRTGAAGASFWLPVTAVNSDIQLPADLSTVNPPTTVAGLWVGEVIIDAVTSIVEDGSPTRPSAGSVPMRLLLHSDAGGAVRLLSQVTLMQTRSADPAVPATPVLVVNPARIPLFEGIKERNGKRLGVRIEAVAYDMPRDASPAAQSENPVTVASDDLVDLIVAESTSPVTKWASGLGLYPTRVSVTQAAIDSYLLFRTTRPPALRETYLLSLPLSGAVGAGKTLRTSAAAPLTLDPFHRSNPFRHAFHHDLPGGPQITRTLEIVFDSDQALPDRLQGSSRETIQGLIKPNLVLTGRVDLRRVSAVTSLEGAQ